MNTCVQNEGAIIDAATDKKRRNMDILETAGRLCEVFENEYNDAEAARRDEMVLLTALRTMV